MSETSDDKEGHSGADTIPVTVHIQPALLTALDSFIDSEPQNPSRPEAIRQLLRDRLSDLGHLNIHLNDG